MMDIIREVQWDKRGVSVCFEGGETLRLSRAIGREWPWMAPGQEVSPEEWNAFLLPRQYSEGLAYAVKLLAMRDHAAGEVRAKLEARRYLPDAVDMVLYKLEKEKLLDDEAFAQKWAASRARAGLGKARVRMELRAKGVPGEVIERVLAEGDGDEADAAMVAFARKQLRRHASEEDQDAAMRKVLSAMARRGYGYSESARAIALALDDEEA